MKTKTLSSLLTLVAIGVLWCCSALSASAKVEGERYYVLTNVHHGMTLSTGGTAAKDSPLVGEAYKKGSPEQLWQLKAVGSDAFALYNPESNLAVDLAIQSSPTSSSFSKKKAPTSAFVQPLSNVKRNILPSPQMVR